MSKQKRKVKRWFISIIMLASVLCAGYSAAQDKDNPQQPVKQGDEQVDEFEEPTYTAPTNIEERLGNLKMPKLERKHLSDKYPGLEKKETFSNLKQTEYGPAGELDISGKIAPKGGWGSVLDGKEGKEERARAIAKAFIGEEAILFGITDMEEMKEQFFKTDEIGFTHISFERYVGGLPIKNVYITIHIGPDETIRSLQSKVVAPSPALYQALANKTIGKGKVFKIVRDSLKPTPDSDVSVGVSKAYKEALLDPPYVIWNVETTSFETINGQPRDWQWEFKIDAFTGEIIQKREKPMATVGNPG